MKLYPGANLMWPISSIIKRNYVKQDIRQRNISSYYLHFSALNDMLSFDFVGHRQGSQQVYQRR